MSKNKKQNEERKPKEPKLKKETKKTIAGIVCFGIALLIILSFFKMAGPVGDGIYRAFLFLFGWLYFFSPIIFIIAGSIFVGSFKKSIYATTIIGLLLLSISLLGISDLIKGQSGGWFGKIFGALEQVFGFWGGFVFYLILGLIGLVVVFEFSLDSINLNNLLKKKEEDFVEPKIAKPQEQEKKMMARPEIENQKEEPKIKETKQEVLDIKAPKAKKEKVIGNWIFPSIELLESDSGKPTSGDIKANLNIIKRTLSNFGIMVDMDEVQIGPTVTRYTLKPAEGVKLSKIVALQNDLSLALAAHPIRIEAPIPGKALVGIEVPNKSKTIVRMKNLVSLEKFWDSDFLTIPLGRDVSGEPVFSNIAKLPHLLVAGSTGSGKSVTIHSILVSLLFKNTPETLRLLLIDPKRVELSIYNGLPHLISDVIINPKKTIMALRWTVSEMDRRYGQLLEEGVRDINSYNQRMLKDKKPLMPFIVLVIDELADLMAAYGREIEGSIVRLAQMARATGVHLIVSTQRPSVEVVTGLIKANITSRIALQVASQIDSRTILDMSGAEKLLGHGDLLYLAAETSKAKRVQGVFISEDEVSRVIKYINENNKEYATETSEQEDFEEHMEKGGNVPVDFENSEDNFDADELYPDAYKIVMEAGKASASFLQRRLRVGYARAARLLDLLEERGIIGPSDGAKPREVLKTETVGQTENVDSEEKLIEEPTDISEQNASEDELL